MNVYPGNSYEPWAAPGSNERSSQRPPAPLSAERWGSASLWSGCAVVGLVALLLDAVFRQGSDVVFWAIFPWTLPLAFVAVMCSSISSQLALRVGASTPRSARLGLAVGLTVGLPAFALSGFFWFLNTYF